MNNFITIVNSKNKKKLRRLCTITIHTVEDIQFVYGSIYFFNKLYTEKLARYCNSVSAQVKIDTLLWEAKETGI